MENKITVKTFEVDSDFNGWDPNLIHDDAYNTERAAALYAAVGAPGPVDEEYVLAGAQDGSGRWALLGLSVRGHAYAVEVGETTTERAHARAGTAYFANDAAKARAATSARAKARARAWAGCGRAARGW